MGKKCLCLALCLMLLGLMVLPAGAEDTVLRITGLSEFLAFAESCRLDSYSQGLTVSLEADLDISGTDFAAIPIFSGTFLGNGHTISGLSITSEGSQQGLFRYLTEEALVQELTVCGEIHPGGSRSQIGGIAGSNAGRIENCTFRGEISGSDYVGGIAGSNTVTAIIQDCTLEGSLHADHFAGGIAGENNGVIRNCVNLALINTTPQQNSVELSDITLDSLTNTESANTVTDIGGIAGISSGVIRECENRGSVGYKLMGYNIGGIAGTQSGYMADCRNYGSIQGRKEVGGIVGQMEPVSVIEYTEDTLQILQGQLNTMTALVNRTSGNAQSNASQISGQIGVLQDQTKTAYDAVKTLFPEENGEVKLPDKDTLLAAESTLSTTLSAMPGTLRSIASATQTTVSGLSRDLGALSGQLNAMGDTLNNASDNLGGTITDVSDQDSADLLTGKVASCTNFGSVLADLNAGGITGAIALENDLDVLEDWEQTGDASLNFQSQLRAVVLSCENTGTVTGKKQNAGGIAGWQNFGLVKNCINTGAILGADADYVGGVAGQSTGYIRSSYAKCEIAGAAYVGGIAGSAPVVTDCIAQISFSGGKEKLGAVLGLSQGSTATAEASDIRGNYYLPIGADPGAIDGISYGGMAQPLDLDSFLALEALPQAFESVTIRFLFEDGTVTEVPVSPGGSLSSRDVPAVPEKAHYTGVWEGLEPEALTGLLFDRTFTAVYTPYLTTIASRQTGQNGLPLLLLEGAFTQEAAVSVAASQAQPPLTNKQTLQGVWTFQTNEAAATARLLIPGGVEAEGLHLQILDSGSTWQQAEATVDGSYLVFALPPGSNTVALYTQARDNSCWYLLIGAVLAVTVLVTAVGIRRKKCKA